MDILADKAVLEVFDHYPASIRQKLLLLRQLILETGAEIEGSEPLQETLKWGEVSYITKGGSTIRLGWKASIPEQYLLYFHCKTKLLDTFKAVYADQFKFDGNRAIVFSEKDEMPIEALKHCISLSLRYHRIKHLPLLGI